MHSRGPGRCHHRAGRAQRGGEVHVPEPGDRDAGAVGGIDQGARPGAGDPARQGRVRSARHSRLRRPLDRRPLPARRPPEPGLGPVLRPGADRPARPGREAEGGQAVRRAARSARPDDGDREAARAADPRRAGRRAGPAGPSRVHRRPHRRSQEHRDERGAVLAPGLRPRADLRLADRAQRRPGARRRPAARPARRPPRHVHRRHGLDLPGEDIMTWLTWRQSRIQFLTAAAALVIIALAYGLTAPGLSHLYASHPADFLTQVKTGKYPLLYFAGGVIMYLAPVIIGAFWGAPMIARELEAGTSRLAWNQSVSRTRWLLVKLAIGGGAAMAFAGIASLLLSWWSAPIDKAGGFPVGTSQLSRFAPLMFGT